MQGRGKSRLTLPRGENMGCICTRSRLAVFLGVLEWFMGALQTAGLQPAPLARPARGDRDDGLGASAMSSSRKSAAFSGDGGPDMGEVGHGFPRDLLTSLEPDQSQGAWAGDGDLPASQPLTRVPVLSQAHSPTSSWV